MAQHYSSSDDTHAMVARLVPAILELLGDGRPRSRHEIVAALAGQHARDEVVRTLMRLAVTEVPSRPWQGRAAEPERTPDRVEIIQTRFGAHVRNPDGPGLVPYETPEALRARLFASVDRKRQTRPVKTWSVSDKI